MKRKFKIFRKCVFIVALLAVIINVFTPFKALATGDVLTFRFTVEDPENMTITTEEIQNGLLLLKRLKMVM